MKARYWSLAIVLILINYLIFATLFTQLIETDFSTIRATRTPVPTFTPAPAEPIIIVPTSTPIIPNPSPTATRVLAAPQSNEGSGASAGGDSQTGAQSAPASGNQPQLVAPEPVNIRSGPGLNYPIIGRLNPNTTRPIVGRNGDASWWQIEITNDITGWVSDTIVNVSNADNVPVVEVSALPAPSPVPAQPAAAKLPPTPKPKHQYEPTGWWDNGNAGLTRFLGEIEDVNGTPVNGVFIRASCGDYAVISNPSGPVGWGRYNESETWPPGFYDLTVGTKPIPCLWILTVVDTDDGQHVKAILSEPVPVEVTLDKSIIMANWQKNW